MDKISNEFEFVPYGREYARVWDEFVETSRNGTFLFKRAYMDYHSDRFKDSSLIALRHGKPAALLPACLLETGVLSSHAGLTYGGWILPGAHIDGSAVLTLFEEWISYCKRRGDISKIVYKPTPYIYHTKPSQEDVYALWRCGFTKSNVWLSSAIDLRGGHGFNMSKRQQVRKAERLDWEIVKSDDYAGFWDILTECLQTRHDTRPVHALSEIEQLKNAFPENIKLHILRNDAGIQAGVCVYDTGHTAHAQYGATTAFAREHYLLAALYHHLIFTEYANRAYFDFGNSNEQGGLILNAGLLNQKFSMGATGVAYEQYELILNRR